MKEKEFSEHFAALTAAQAAAESRRLSLPQKPDEYPLELPKEFKPPEGVKFELNANDPLWAQAKSWALKNGLSKEAFIEGIGLIAGRDVATEQTIKTARDAEITKLGPTGPARLSAVTTWLKSYLGDAEGTQLASRLFTARDVEIAEKLLQKVTTQGGATYRGNGREPPETPGRLTAEQIAKLSPRERLDYSRQFDQSQMPAWKDPRS